MSKLPKLGDLTSSVPGIFDKMKNFIDTLAGSSKTAATEEALQQEDDPLKAKVLEVELALHQYSDLLNYQQSALTTLKSKFSELQKILESQQKEAESASED